MNVYIVWCVHLLRVNEGMIKAGSLVFVSEPESAIIGIYLNKFICDEV